MAKEEMMIVSEVEKHLAEGVTLCIPPGVTLLNFFHRGPTQSVCVADCYFIVNVLDLPFASPMAIYR